VYTKHRTNTNKTKNTTQKTKKMSNTNSTKIRGCLAIFPFSLYCLSFIDLRSLIKRRA
jgi:hypothetical protein